MALIVIIALILGSGKTIDLNDYLTIETEGYDGYGKATAAIDWGAIDEKYGKKIKFKRKLNTGYAELMGMYEPLDYVRECVGVHLDKSSELSNGDEIGYTWNIDEEFLSQIVKCKFKYKDGEYKVTDLDPVGKRDVFEDVSLEFSGIAPNSYAQINYTGSDFNTYNFRCDKANDLKNGDTVTVTLDIGDVGYFAQNNGWVPETMSKEYTVSGLQEYVMSYSDLTDDFLNQAKGDAEDAIYAYTAGSYGKGSSLSDLKYAGYIMNTAKEGGYYSYYNILYIIYSGTVSSTEGKFNNTKVYYPVRFTNILKGDEGLTYDGNTNIDGSSSLGGSWSYTNGYVNPLNCYMELVEANRDNYNTECGDGFEIYDKYETIGKLDDISKGYRDSLASETKDLIESYIAKDYSDKSEVADLKVAGEYLLIAKNQGSDFKLNNKYYVVYSATLSNKDDRFDPLTVYYPVEYEGIVKLPGDEYMVTASGGIQGNSSIPDTWYYTKGYVDESEMYSDIVTSNRDNYTFEVSGSLKKS